MGFVTNEYKKIHGIKQEHTNGCWAACLAWWMKATKHPLPLSQHALRQESDIKSMYSSDSTTGQVLTKKNANYGVLEKWELLSVFRQPRFGMFVHEESNINPWHISEALHDYGPIVIGFFDSFAQGNHVNVICGFDVDTSMVEVMEPRTGHFIERGLTTYTGGPQPNIFAWKQLPAVNP